MRTSTDTRLGQFIEAAKTKGASDEGLAAILSRESWPAAQVYAALGEYWARIAGVEIPARAGYGESSRDAFLYLLSFSTLTTWAFALGALLFDLIDHWLPDPIVSAGSAMLFRSALTWQMASLAVAFPIYLLVTRRIVDEVWAEPERLQSGVRKWLTWIALLLTAGGMMSDLIWFLDYFLTGELTLRFVLRCLVVFATTGAIFAYYVVPMQPARVDRSKGISRDFLFGAGASAVVVIAFFISLLVAGTPTTQRHLEADKRRVSDLRQIAFALFVYREQNGSMPPSLNEPLVRQRLGSNTARDPETNAAYEYQMLGPTRYQLCAEFNSASADGASFWNHPAGRNCYELDTNQRVPQ